MPEVHVAASSWSWRPAGRRNSTLTELSFTIEVGERVLLLGPSGSGKTTLLHALAGVLTPEEGDTSGTLSICDRNPQDPGLATGLVQQDPDANIILSRVGDDIAFGCENRGIAREAIWRNVRDALDAVGLNLPLDHPTAHLSGGQKQRLGLAAVLAMNASADGDQPNLLLLDEPTANIDPDSIPSVRDAVAAAVADRKTTMILVEHRLDAWVDLIDRVLVLNSAGELIADGSPSQVLKDQAAELRRAGVWLPGERPPVHETTRTSQSPDVLWTRDLVIGYPTWSLEPALNFGVPRGAVTAITGMNGAGKTTMALTLAGLLKPRSGRVVVDEELRAPLPPKKACKLFNASNPATWNAKDLLPRIGMVFQEPDHQFVTNDVRSEIGLGMRLLRAPETAITARTDELLARLRLTELAGANPHTLSGGEKRRLSVATALATQPRVVVLDEPTFGQDRNTWTELVALISELATQGISIVTVSHDPDFVAATADLQVVIARD